MGFAVSLSGSTNSQVWSDSETCRPGPALGEPCLRQILCEQAGFVFPQTRPDSLTTGGGWVRSSTASLRKKQRGPQGGGRAESSRTVFRPRASQLGVHPVLCHVTAGGHTRLYREGPVSGEAALLGVSSVCHICIYLELSWWSSVSGMPIVGLAQDYLRFVLISVLVLKVVLWKFPQPSC